MEIDPLDALYEEVMEASRRKKVTVKALPTDRPAATRLSPGYADISNWTQGATVALVHQGPLGATLLGAFHSYTYPYLPGSRQLIRVDGPAEVSGTEYVTGDWWLHPHAEEMANPARWNEERTLALAVTLKECTLHCPTALCKVRLSFGGIARVELIDSTKFICPTRNTFLILPSGLDILSSMDYESKVALRRELNEENDGNEPQD